MGWVQGPASPAKRRCAVPWEKKDGQRFVGLAEELDWWRRRSTFDP
jgi:hypothetical protein